MDSLKTQLSLTGQKLGQLRAKSVSQANITRSDIATLIQQCSLAVAREKAEKLISEEVYQDLLLDIERYIDTLQEGCHELYQNLPLRSTLIEAASTVIYATPYIYCKELDACRDSLTQRLGIDFARSAIGTRVSQNVLSKLSTPTPSAAQLDDYLQGIANTYGVLWTSPLTPEHTITALSELLDIETQEEVDLLKLRKLCRQGIPEDPEWLRPRIWKLLLGVISPTKKSWKVEMAQQRNTYYDLVRRILDPYHDLNSERLPADNDILTIHRQLAGLPGSLYALLEDRPESFKPSPLDQNAPDDSKIASASWLDARLSVLQQGLNESHLPPDVCIESDVHSTPSISLTSFESNSSTTSATTSTTLLSARERVFGNAHPHHCSSLLRLLFIHKMINPGSSLAQSASILVPLYSVLMREVDSEDLPHLEADSFWLLEAVVAEFTGLEDDIEKWMNLLSERLRWADYDLYCDLESCGLDPSLPHYSYRWLMPLLSHTLPLRSLFVAWDSLFSVPPRSRGTHPKLNHLVDICTSMLLRAKTHLIRLGTLRYRAQSLWSPGADSLSQSRPTVDRPQDAFAEALSFLQVYDPSKFGGIGRILQTVSDLAERRQLEVGHPRWSSLGSHFKSDLWGAFKPQRHLQELREAGDVSESVGGPGPSVSGNRAQYSFSAQVTDFVWRGITNRSAMDDGPTSPPLSSQSLPRTSHNSKIAPSASQRSSTIQLYVGKLKESDTVAKLSKMGSNWHAGGFLPSWSILSPNTSDSSSEPTRGEQDTAPNVRSHSSTVQESDLGPLVSSPIFMHSPALKQSLDGSAPSSPSASGKLIEKTKNLVSRTQTGPSIPGTGMKSAPRPLLLNSSSSIISSYSQPQPGSDGDRSTPATDEWGDVMRAKRHNFYRDSQSSISSLSPSDAFGHLPRSAKSDTEANPSRVVALNRRSISPMAPAFRVNRPIPSSRKSSVSSGYDSPSIPTTSQLHRAANLVNEDGTGSFSLLTSLKKYKEEQSDSSRPALNELPTYQKAFPAGGDCSADSAASSLPRNLINTPAKMRTKKSVRPPDLQIRNVPRTHTSNSPNNSKLTVEWPVDEHESILTPKATSFNPGNSPSHSRPLRRSRKVSGGDPTRPGKSAADDPDERADKLPSGYRTRKTFEGSRDTSRSRRESAGIEGDDEGYDELLSAYESEDGPNSSQR